MPTRLNPVHAQSFVDPNMGTNVCKVCGQTTPEGKQFYLVIMFYSIFQYCVLVGIVVVVELAGVILFFILNGEVSKI